jgi:outer membrane protein TolC
VFAETREGVRELYAFARTNEPAMQVSRARLRAASAAVDYAIADLGPTFGASLSLNWTDPMWFWRWGVDAAQSLFTGWRKTAAVDRATVALESASAEVDSAELALSFSIEQAVAERDNAREALSSATASVRSAKENLDTVTEQLSVGDASRIEYTDAVADFVSSLASCERAFYRGQVAEARLFALLGLRPEYVK